MRMLAAAFACLVLAAGCSPPPVRQPGSAALTDCQLVAPGASDGLTARCGRLTVPENRASDRGRTLQIRYAVLKATGRERQPDPLFMLAGGPGQAATVAFLPVLPAFARVNRSRDIVLVDQRGTGESRPLNCPDEASAGADPAAAAIRCATHLRIDANLYGTDAFVDDLDAVRQALGYERINLYGASYGSRAALVYLRRYPAHARAAVLDGVVPLDWHLGETAAGDAQEALDRIFARCRRDPTCRRTYPELAVQLARLLGNIGSRRLSLPDPATGQPKTLPFDRDRLAATVRLLSYTPETAALLPLAIARAGRGDLTTLAAQSLLAVGEFGEGFSEGLYYAITCAEDIPFIRPAVAADAARRSYLGAVAATRLAAGCPAWRVRPVASDFKQPVASDVPVLLLSGEADPVTPPANAERAGRTLRHSRRLVFPGQGHIVAVRGCAPLVIARFLETAAVEGLATNCVQASRPPDFFIDGAGPPH